jgi:hypothetical protein
LFGVFVGLDEVYFSLSFSDERPVLIDRSRIVNIEIGTSQMIGLI